MRVKRFRAKTVNEALAAVRKELGGDAVILKTTKVPKQGVLSCLREEEIEVIAATENSEGTPEIQKTSAPELAIEKEDNHKIGDKNNKRLKFWAKNITASQEKKTNNTAKNNGTSKNEKTYNASARVRNWQNPTIDEVTTGIYTESTLRTFDYNCRLWANDETLPPQLLRERNALTKSGVHPKLATKLLRNAISTIGQDEPINSERIRERILFHIAGLINTSGPLNCQANTPKVVALVGPTGVGKTTTLAKLAVNGKYNYKKKVSLISADTYRMAALEHLTTFANIAQLPLSAVYSPEDFRTAVLSQNDSDLILIDTAGRGQHDKEYIVELKQFFKSVNDVEVHLVLAANMKSADLLGIIKQFNILSIDRILLTKVDETRTLGSILNVISHLRSPLSYVTFGQSVPEDIELANAQKLARMILRY